MNISKVYQTAIDSYGNVCTLVRGLPYQCPNDWEEVLDSLDEDSNLYLIKEPDNPKDKLAIAAYLDKRRVGYVAASDNEKIWLYLTDEKMPCKFIQRYDASFKVSFENPHKLFEHMSFEEIYKDKDGVTKRPYPAFEIPFLADFNDMNYDWFDDQTYIKDLEEFIPDFRRKLAVRLIILVGRKNSKGEYCYYLPYANNFVANICNDTIKDLVDDYGFVVALPDVPMKLDDGDIFMDLHVTYLTGTTFRAFNSKHHSELVFNVTRDFVNIVAEDAEGEYGDNCNEDIELVESNPTVGSSSAINDFFPLWGITLGKTTWKQAEEMGFPVITYADGSQSINVGSLSFEDWKGEGVFTMLHIEKSDPVPPKWKTMGFSWDNSYDEWVNVFKTLGYNINVKHQPKVLDGSVLYAEFDALSQDGTLLFCMNFKYGENGCQTSSPNTLYSIIVCYIGSSSSRTSQKNSKTDEKTPKKVDYGEESYTVSDFPEGGKHVSMDIILPEEGDEDFDFCSYECYISDKKHIDIIKKHMKRFEQGIESRPFIMIGRPCLGLDSLDIFYSLDGEIIFNFIIDEKIRKWIREAGFVLGKVKSYHADKYLPERLNITLSVSKRKSGETLFKQASEEAMDYIEEVVSSTADYKVEGKVIDAVNDYLDGDANSPYQVAVVPWKGLAVYTTLDGEQIGIVLNSEILEMTKKNKGIIGHVTDVKYNNDYTSVKFTIRVSRSIPRLSLETSANSTEVSSPLSNDFFPLFGFTLGKTTLEQAKSMGYELKNWEDDPEKFVDVRSVSFYYDDLEEVFTSLLWNRDDCDFPSLWKSKGFSWELSYNAWINLFRKLECKITIKKEPIQRDFNGHKVLSAEFEALSPDNTLLFELDFDYGENGCETSSPKTLDYISVKYDVTATDVAPSLRVGNSTASAYNTPNNSIKPSFPSVNDFFPIIGFTLGETTWEQAEEMGYKVKIRKEGPGRYADVRGILFYDDDGEGVFTSLMWVRFDPNFPPSWRAKGFFWNNSYDDWMSVFNHLGFKIDVKEEPKQVEYNGRKSLSARFEALSFDGTLLFELEFGFGKEGYYTSSPKTLTTIWVTYNRT